MTQNGQCHQFCNFSNLFQLKQCRMTQNSQCNPFCNFSNLFPLKWCRMTWNGQNWSKLKYLSRFSTNLHQTFRTRLTICASQNESKKCYATIETDKNFNISADSQPICTELSEQGSFFWTSWNESKKCYAIIKAVENLNISVDSQCSHEISLYVGYTMLL